MPRERPVHHPRPHDDDDEDDEADLGIYDDDEGHSTSSAELDDIAAAKRSSATLEEENDDINHGGRGRVVSGESVKTDDLPPLDIKEADREGDVQDEDRTDDQNTARTQTDEETDRAVKRVDIATTPHRDRRRPTAVETPARDLEEAREEWPADEEKVVERLPSATTAMTQESALRLHDNRSIPPRNTPVTEADMEDLRELESRLTGADSRRACYERAVSLLKTRCTSQLLVPTRDQIMPAAGRCLSGNATEFYYIKQEKPQPMPPLRVWRGFHGNVYFEPISVSKFRVSPPATASSVNSRQHQHHVKRSKTEAAFRQMAILDRERIDRHSNAFLPEDLAWLHGQASTGSLRTQLGFNKPKMPYNRERIMKGSVAKSMVATFNRLTPLKVSGGRCSSPSKAPPFLQCQTQYSNSEKRRMFPDIIGNSEYVSVKNPDTNTMVHIVPTRATPPRAPMTSPLATPH